ncbi:MAG: CvpA family protein [Syntrophobacterales bacterium]
MVLVVFYWGVRLLSYVLQRLLYHLYLDVVDRLLGAFFALIKGALILGFALLLVGIVIPKDNRLLKGSRARPILIQLARRTLDLLPPDFKERLKELLHTVPFPGEKKQAEAPEKVGPRLAGTREIQAVSVGWAPPPVVFRIANPVYVRTDYGNQRQFWRHRFSNLCRRRTKQATTFIRPRFADKCIILVGQYWGKGSLYRAARGRRYWRARHDLSLPHQVCQR